jgi:serine/threonine-protein phosphatase PGAM5
MRGLAVGGGSRLNLRRPVMFHRICRLRWAAAFTACCALSAAPVLAQDAAPKADGIRTVYLIRHGDYDDADERDPFVGRGLVPLGVAQARLVGARLRGMPVTFTSLQSSTMTRARQTAQVIGEEFPALQLEASRSISECTPPTRRQDIMDGETAEDLAACTQQLEDAFQRVFAPSPDADRNDIVVCHGNVIRYFVTKVLGVDTEAWLGMSIGNCSLTVVQVKPDGSMTLLSFSDTGHIAPNLTTRTGPGPPIDLNPPGEAVAPEVTRME